MNSRRPGSPTNKYHMRINEEFIEDVESDDLLSKNDTDTEKSYKEDDFKLMYEIDATNHNDIDFLPGIERIVQSSAFIRKYMIRKNTDGLIEVFVESDFRRFTQAAGFIIKLIDYISTRIGKVTSHENDLLIHAKVSEESILYAKHISSDDGYAIFGHIWLSDYQKISHIRFRKILILSDFIEALLYDERYLPYKNINISQMITGEPEQVIIEDWGIDY